MAPRVHNSGHWTIEGAADEPVREPPAGHLRPAARPDRGCAGYSAMVNLIGSCPIRRRVLAVPGAHLHLYGKAPRPGRKLGHVTIGGEDEGSVRERALQILALIPDS